jgi:hypothetical protein
MSVTTARGLPSGGADQDRRGGRATMCRAPSAERRCLCGNLLARLVPGGVELKCRRCKQIVVVALLEDRSRR